jgi:hypothetical protein
VPYVRSGTRIVFILFAYPLIATLTLVGLALEWTYVLYLGLSALLIVANVQTLLQVRPAVRMIRSTSLLVNEIVGTLGTVAVVVLPWVSGGFSPSREDLTAGILVAFVTALLSVAAIVLSVFDTATIGAHDRTSTPEAMAVPGSQPVTPAEAGRTRSDQPRDPRFESRPGRGRGPKPRGRGDSP